MEKVSESNYNAYSKKQDDFGKENQGNIDYLKFID